MFEIICTINFILAYVSYFFYKKFKERVGFLGLGIIVFSFGFINFLCGIILLSKLIREQ